MKPGCSDCAASTSMVIRTASMPQVAALHTFESMVLWDRAGGSVLFFPNSAFCVLHSKRSEPLGHTPHDQPRDTFAPMRVSVPHNTDKETARRKVEARLHQLLAQYKQYLSDSEHRWEGD